MTFNRTYKELKRLLGFYCVNNSKTFNRTYKELKPDNIFVFLTKIHFQSHLQGIETA